MYYGEWQTDPEWYPGDDDDQPVVMCNCEHTDHWNGTDHEYVSVPAGEQTAWFVGKVCDHCAETHMREYLNI
jgi:hypothetical protein